MNDLCGERVIFQKSLIVVIIIIIIIIFGAAVAKVENTFGRRRVRRVGCIILIGSNTRNTQIKG